jgi:Integrase zinc binding domain
VLWQAYEHETAPVMCAIQPQACAATAAADVIAPEGFSMQQWSTAQRADAMWAPWFDYFEQQRLPLDTTVRSAMLREAHNFRLTTCIDGTLVLQHCAQHAIKGEVLQLVVPSAIKRQVMKQCHDTRWQGHVGPDKTIHTIRTKFWWPTLVTDCTTYCRSFIDCQQRKRAWSKQQSIIHWPVTKPLQRIAMDLLDLKTASTDRSRYVMVVSEYWTKWKYLFALPEKTQC